MANRLFLFANFVALSLETGVKVAYPGFDEVARFFPTFEADILCRFPPRWHVLGKHTIPKRAVYWVGYRLNAALPEGWGRTTISINRENSFEEAFGLRSSDFLKLVRTERRLVVVQGWLFHNEPGLKMFHADIVRAFAPQPQVLKHVRRLQAVDPDAEVKIGVHVRRGDYATFLGGKYFYSHDAYSAIMERVRASLLPRRCLFLVVSDSPIPSMGVANAPTVNVSASAVEDLYALAACDYIVGPPSTFSLWASYYGQKPLYMIRDPDAGFSLDDFRIARSQLDFPELAALHRRSSE